MDRKTDKLVSAIGDIDTAYLEEVLDFNRTNAGRRKRTRFPKLSAACAAVLIILGVSVTAFAISRIPLSWRDIFSSGQTVIGDADEAPVISQQQPQAAATEELQIKVEKVISDERALYLLYSVKANEGAVLDQTGKFADFELYFPGKMMSGAYVSRFLERKAGVLENELEGVVYADWQPGDSANGLVIGFSDWQEKPLDSESFTTVLSGHWQVTLDETPITIESEVLAENVPLAYGGETLQVKKVACSKLSMAVYFDSYVDSTADNWTLEIFDANGDLIPSWWGFIAAQTDDSCMFLTRFDEPIEPETIRKLTFNGETVFER